MEVDHIFICTQAGAPEAEALLEFGLIEGEPNKHLGQGTANRRFFFHNAMLELLWVEDIDEVQSELTKPMKLYERCFPTDDTVSPFGIAFRPSDIKEEVSFEAWDYHPMYLPDSLKIQVATNAPIPLCQDSCQQEINVIIHLREIRREQNAKRQHKKQDIYQGTKRSYVE